MDYKLKQSEDGNYTLTSKDKRFDTKKRMVSGSLQACTKALNGEARTDVWRVQNDFDKDLIMEQIIELRSPNKRIATIKLIRSLFKIGLKEAKELMERYEDRQ